MSNFNRKEKGQGLVEYALILVLVAVVVIVVLQVLGPLIGDVFTDVNDGLAGNTLPDTYIWSIVNDDPDPKATCDLLIPGGSYAWGNGPNGLGCYIIS